MIIFVIIFIIKIITFIIIRTMGVICGISLTRVLYDHSISTYFNCVVATKKHLPRVQSNFIGLEG